MARGLLVPRLERAGRDDLDRDLLTADPDGLRKARVMGTYINGEKVH
jgi:hypothetical protein